ncbi:hypothetical protein LQ757_11450 [Agromyces sp. SYSU K20354]|uniref:hypothetical protein n=1 Tax=Agromyces cavernae TaxID=2898659 RepID=UPI001E389DDF|nr:hypothetical protein [Agromyces cavernae]MCD2442888.1 hypothetical protein [Agromyces cavernae]
MADAIEGWSEFNVAMLGATAALAGLLIVAMSVNIGEIMKTATLPSRAAAAIATLVVAIVATALGLVPGQPHWLYGAEVLAATLVAGELEVHAMRTILNEPGTSGGQRIAKSVVGLLPLASFIVGAVLLIVGGAGGGLALVAAGLAFLAAGSVLAVVTAILYAWIVLVEVLR